MTENTNASNAVGELESAFSAFGKAISDAATAIINIGKAFCKLIVNAVMKVLNYLILLCLSRRERNIYRCTKKKRTRKKYRDKALRGLLRGMEATQ
jgi:hypothetical protein